MNLKLTVLAWLPGLLLLAACGGSINLEPSAADVASTRELRETKVEKPIDKSNADKVKTGTNPAPVPASPEEQIVPAEWEVIFPENRETVLAFQKKAIELDRLSDDDFKKLLRDYATRTRANGGIELDPNKADVFVAKYASVEKSGSHRSTAFALYQFTYDYASKRDADGGLGLSPEKARAFVDQVFTNTADGLGVEYLILHQKAYQRLRQESCPDCFDRDAAVDKASEEAFNAILVGILTPSR